MDLSDCRFDGKGHFKIGDYPTSANVDKDERQRYEELAEQNNIRMAELQDKLYAEAREGVVVLFGYPSIHYSKGIERSFASVHRA